MVLCLWDEEKFCLHRNAAVPSVDLKLLGGGLPQQTQTSKEVHLFLPVKWTMLWQCSVACQTMLWQVILFINILPSVSKFNNNNNDNNDNDNNNNGNLCCAQTVQIYDSTRRLIWHTEIKWRGQLAFHCLNVRTLYCQAVGNVLKWTIAAWSASAAFNVRETVPTWLTRKSSPWADCSR